MPVLVLRVYRYLDVKVTFYFLVLSANLTFDLASVIVNFSDNMGGKTPRNLARSHETEKSKVRFPVENKYTFV